jgi:tetratricopeptide (TPR) repeat protein
MVPIREAIDHAARYGYGPLSTGMTLLSLQVLLDMGAWDDALEIFDQLNVPGDPAMRQTYGAQYRIYALRGRREEALVGAQEMEERARQSPSAEVRVVALATAATIRAVAGDVESGCRLIEETAAIPEASATQAFISMLLPDMVRAACDAGNVDLAEQLLRDAKPRFPYAGHAQTAARALVAERRARFDEALGRHREAAALWASFTIPLEEGYARLGEARCLMALGHRDAAQAPLSKARAIFEGLGAIPALAKVTAIETAAAVSPAAPG